jgi:outer membrane protein insertion porin family
VRSELWGVAALPLTDAVGLKFAASAGVVLPWGKGWESTATSIADRFFIGGPETLRGFRTRGVGPSDMRRQAPASAKEGEGSSTSDGEAGKKTKLQRDYLGGDLKLTGFAAMTFKFPNRILSSLNVKGQVFVNAGTITPLCGPGGLDTSVLPKRIVDDMRITTGVGIMFPISVGLIELNYCHINKFKDTDRVKRGIQFSITPGGGIV